VGTAMTLSFFFSSRRRHTRSKRDWSSDVCSSDLQAYGAGAPVDGKWCDRVAQRLGEDVGRIGRAHECHIDIGIAFEIFRHANMRSEERRVGKEGRYWWGACP